MNIKITAIILAAGRGKRMNSNVAKQFLTLHEKPVLYYSLKAFEDSGVDEIILVTGHDQLDYCRKEIVELYNMNKVTQIIEGGKERYNSVYCALESVVKTDYVLIHDGARPFITPKLIDDIIHEVIECKGCIFGVPVKETIKVVNQSDYIASTPDRDTLWAAQTPQAFDCNEIRKAYQLFMEDKNRPRIKITDDAMVYETYLKKPVKVLLGDYYNMKITTPEDIYLAEVVLSKYVI